MVDISIGITNSRIWLKSCVVTAETEKYNSIIKKKRKTHDEIVLLELKAIEVLIFKALIDSYIINDEFVRWK